MFIISLLGTILLIAYKIIAIRIYGVSWIARNDVPLSMEVHSLEQHVGAFLQERTKKYGTKAFYYIQENYIPAIIQGIKNITAFIVRILKHIGHNVFHNGYSLDHGTIPPRGASSFFLKNISEHKKNIKKKERDLSY